MAFERRFSVLVEGAGRPEGPVLVLAPLHADAANVWTAPIISAGHETLPLFLQMYEHPSYRANATIVFGTQPENTDLFPQQAELAQQWNSVYAYPKLQYSGFHDALKNIAQQFGNDIPTVSGDGGPYWETALPQTRITRPWSAE